MKKIAWIACLIAVVSCQSSASQREADDVEMDSAGPRADAANSQAPDATVEGEICNSSVGMVAPASVCSPADRCDNIAALDDETRADRPSDIPTCATSSDATADGRGAFDDGPPQTWVDPDDVTRSWCQYVPPGVDASNPAPVLVFLHGSVGLASDVYNSTSLRQKAQDAGIILVSLQARNLNVPTVGRTDTSKWDEFHRDLTTASGNRDVAFIDHVVDSLAGADPQRIHLSGWSNGGFMAQLYAIARHETPTPGGNRVASAAVYSAADPFHHIVGDDDACQLAPYPTSNVPILVVSRSCDAIACDEAQANALRAAGADVPPGRVVGTWIADAENKVGASVEWLRLSGLFELAGRVVDECSANCPSTRAVVNHVRWPDGVADDSGIDHEPAMLKFLADHPLQ